MGPVVIPVILIEQSHASAGWARRHKLELAVVVLTPPVLPAGLQALRILRLLRLLRLVVAVKLARRLFSVEGLKYATILTVVVIIAGGYAFASAENTTTGTGDVVGPSSPPPLSATAMCRHTPRRAERSEPP